MGTRVPGFLSGCALLLVAVPAPAQTLAGTGRAPSSYGTGRAPSSYGTGRAPSSYGCEISTSDRRLRIGETHWRLTGRVELLCGDATVYSNEADLFLEEDRAVATGSVVFSQGNNRIAADRADFNIRTRLGVFYHASGIAAAQTQTARVGPVGGAGGPPQSAEDSDIYFFGETVEKIGPKKYRITNGGFSTCVQPTPRWNLAADSIVLDLDHYTRLQQAIFSVKGVPMFYMPVLYYPTNREDRATGFLLPTYGTSSLRGQQIRNAFFWAIDRSQDATFMHEWHSKAGPDVSGEYRYNFGRGSEGVFGARLLHGLDLHPAAGGSGVGGAPGVPSAAPAA